MRLDRPFDPHSLRAKLLSRYLIILGIGGIVTSLIGSQIVSSTIMSQANREVAHNMATARTLYQQRLLRLERIVSLIALGPTLEERLAAGDTAAVVTYLDRIRRDNGFDFLTLTDERGRVVLRVTRPRAVGDDVSGLRLVAAALAGTAAAATEILESERLANEDPVLDDRARLALVDAPRAGPDVRRELASGMVLMAAAPVPGPGRPPTGVLYGGVLLNRNLAVVDEMWDILYRDERYRGRDAGSVSLFQGDTRISTNVRTETGERAVGTRLSGEVGRAVLDEGETWNARAYLVDDWYLTASEPIRNFAGDVIGVLYVGVLERLYTSSRNRVILLFFAIATAGFLFITIVTDYMVRQITRPIGEMVRATHSIAAGRFGQDVGVSSADEVGQLAQSFNTMLASLRQMRGDLEEWGSTLEDKVAQRTDELIAMQHRVAQSERLASLGMLAAGVAHEINNPLGGILSLTALALEDMPEKDPARENLEEVIRQSERCKDIVRGLLAFSRQQEAGSERVDVRQVLNETLALVSKQAFFFNIDLVKKCERDQPSVTADRSQLQQVFMNIIMNAVQAMGERGTLTVETRGADGFVETRISDTGKGIPAEDIDRIFDPFYSTKADGEGTGLGLSIAYGIVTKDRGHISVESELGKGTTFIIRLPATPRFADEEPA
jgi:two-component system NtrC family sensor kinase